MALEEELQNAELESAKEEKETKNNNFDDLTDEDIIIPVSALKREGQDRLLDVMEKIVKGE